MTVPKLAVALSAAAFIAGAAVSANAQERTPPDTSVKALEPPVDQRAKQNTGTNAPTTVTTRTPDAGPAAQIEPPVKTR